MADERGARGGAASTSQQRQSARRGEQVQRGTKEEGQSNDARQGWLGRSRSSSVWVAAASASSWQAEPLQRRWAGWNGAVRQLWAGTRPHSSDSIRSCTMRKYSGSFTSVARVRYPSPTKTPGATARM